MPVHSVAALPAGKRVRRGIAALALLLGGAIAGGAAVSLTRPGVVMAAITPTPIARLGGSTGIVTVRGRVTEAYGDRFVVQDATGHTLVEAGPGGRMFAAGNPVTVQGRFEHGELHARFLVDASDRAQEVGPPPPPPPPRPGRLPPPGPAVPPVVPETAAGAPSGAPAGAPTDPAPPPPAAG